MPLVQDDVLNALKQCYDPEIPVNIVDLGLIYEIRFADVPENQQDVTVDMTLTAQGCPEHVNISAQVKSRVEQLPGVRNANVNILWNRLDSGTAKPGSPQTAGNRVSPLFVVRCSSFASDAQYSPNSSNARAARLSANSSILPPILIARSRNRVPCRTYDGSSSRI